VSLDASPYGRAFFEKQRGGSRGSADVVVPLLQRWLRPKSVLDVGCGVGTWLAVWRANGVADAVGVDGEHVDRSLLQVPEPSFLARDLTRPFDLGRTFDLVTSLEVAEHLPPSAADTLVASLVRHGDVVLFSAAIPGQGGDGHVNEEWPEAWARRFARHGFRWADPLRPILWNDPRVESWYAQNALLYYRPERLPTLPWEPPRPGEWPMPLVHPRTTRSEPKRRGSVRRAWRELRRAIRASLFGSRSGRP
jgi:SAM-dependent methyltransferase